MLLYSVIPASLTESLFITSVSAYTLLSSTPLFVNLCVRQSFLKDLLPDYLAVVLTSFGVVCFCPFLSALTVSLFMRFLYLLLVRISNVFFYSSQLVNTWLFIVSASHLSQQAQIQVRVNSIYSGVISLLPISLFCFQSYFLPLLAFLQFLISA